MDVKNKNNSSQSKTFRFKFSKCCQCQPRSNHSVKEYLCQCCEEKKKKSLKKRKYTFKHNVWDSNLTKFSLNQDDTSKESKLPELSSEDAEPRAVSPFRKNSSEDFHPSKEFEINELSIISMPLPSNQLKVCNRKENWELQLNLHFKDETFKSDLKLLSILAALSLGGPKMHGKYCVKNLMKNLVPPPQKTPSFIEDIHSFTNSTSETLCLATKSYFHFINPFFPLFTQKGFSKYPRSRLLKLVVWRVGLQYLSPSKLKISIGSYIDETLHNFLKPSKLIPNLDTLQALLIFYNLVFTPSLFYLKKSLFYYAISTFYSLGLHDSIHTYKVFTDGQQNIPLERQLLINQINSLALHDLSKEELPLMKPKNELSFRLLEYAYSECSHVAHEDIVSSHGKLFSYWTSLDSLRSRSSFMFQSTANQARQNDLFFENFDLISSTLDLSVLIYDHSFQKFIRTKNTLATMYSFVTIRPEYESLYVKHLSRAENLLQASFLSGVSFLDKIKMLYVPVVSENNGFGFNEASFMFNSCSVFGQVNIFECLNCFENLKVSQMQLMLCIQFHYFRLEILKLQTYIDSFNDPPRVSKLPLDHKSSLASSKGLFSAIKLIDLLNLVSSAAFFFKRGLLLSSATEFILQYFGLYITKPDPVFLAMLGITNNSDAPKIVERLLVSALEKARKITSTTGSASVTKRILDAV